MQLLNICEPYTDKDLWMALENNSPLSTFLYTRGNLGWHPMVEGVALPLWWMQGVVCHIAVGWGYLCDRKRLTAQTPLRYWGIESQWISLQVFNHSFLLWPSPHPLSLFYQSAAPHSLTCPLFYLIPHTCSSFCQTWLRRFSFLKKIFHVASHVANSHRKKSLAISEV